MYYIMYQEQDEIKIQNFMTQSIMLVWANMYASKGTSPALINIIAVWQVGVS